MSRYIYLGLLLLCGLGLIAWGWLVPAHLRAVDAQLIEHRGKKSTSVVEEGMNLVQLEKIGPAWMLLQVAREEGLDGASRLNEAVGNLAREHPELVLWGGADPYLERIFRPDQLKIGPAVDQFVGTEERESLLEFLQQSRRPGVEEILRNRELTETRFFPPVSSASGQPFEITILLMALMYQGDHLSPPFRETIEQLAREANRGGETVELERLYLELLSLGKRFNWVQLIHLVRGIEDAETLKGLAHWARAHEDKLPHLFTAVHLSGNPDRLTRYLGQYSESGLSDITFALRHGKGALELLLDRGQRIFYGEKRDRFLNHEPFYSAFASLLEVAETRPVLGLIAKCGLLLLGGFLMARSSSFLRRPGSPFEPSPILQPIKGLTLSRHGLFATGFLLFLLVVTEPYLAQDSQELQLPQLRLEIPLAQSAVLAQIKNTFDPNMNQLTILALVVFLVMQAIIYIICLLKLAEIRRQPVSSQLKLKLLDNEENMFDSGLYCGLGGTVAALIFLAFGVIEPSLMAAYASTLFGIICVALLKICHLRPYRRRLILETDTVTS